MRRRALYTEMLVDNGIRPGKIHMLENAGLVGRLVAHCWLNEFAVMRMNTASPGIMSRTSSKPAPQGDAFRSHHVLHPGPSAACRCTRAEYRADPGTPRRRSRESSPPPRSRREQRRCTCLIAAKIVLRVEVSSACLLQFLSKDVEQDLGIRTGVQMPAILVNQHRFSSSALVRLPLWARRYAVGRIDVEGLRLRRGAGQPAVG